MSPAEARRAMILEDGRQEAAAYVTGLAATMRVVRAAAAGAAALDIPGSILAAAIDWLNLQLLDAAENLAALNQGRPPRWDAKTAGGCTSRAILELAFAAESRASHGCQGSDAA